MGFQGKTHVQSDAAHRLWLYSAVGSRLHTYGLDTLTGRLTLAACADMPAKVQYAWQHPRLPVWYVATSSGGPRQPSLHNHVSAWRMRDDGGLQRLGAPQSLPLRPVHVCVHPSGQFLLCAHNYGGGNLTVLALNSDGAIAGAITQQTQQDFGIYPHQVRVLPSGDHALIVDRGNNASGGVPENPGALRTYRLHEDAPNSRQLSGQLGAGQVVAPNGGYGFGPRHVDFHPSGRWMYVADERHNRLHVFALDGAHIQPTPLQSLSTLAQPQDTRPRQLAGPIHVHPSGLAVYVANRADGTVERNGRTVFAGGENTIAVFAIEPQSGQVTSVQHADTGSLHVRTFALDGAARVLVAASIKPMETEGGRVAASLTCFRIDGIRLESLNRIDVDTPNDALQYWMGLAAPSVH